jgi:hypothetical protein
VTYSELIKESIVGTKSNPPLASIPPVLFTINVCIIPSLEYVIQKPQNTQNRI